MDLYLFSQALEAYKYVCDNHITVYDRKGNEYPMLAYCVPSYRLSKVGSMSICVIVMVILLATQSRREILPSENRVWEQSHTFFCEKHL